VATVSCSSLSEQLAKQMANTTTTTMSFLTRDPHRPR
jgi:hypothetical protein